MLKTGSTELIINKAKFALSDLMDSYNKGEITAKSDLAAKCIEAIDTLYSSLSSPALTVEENRRGEVLRKEMLTLPLSAIDSDLSLLFNELASIIEMSSTMQNLISAGIDDVKTSVDEVSALFIDSEGLKDSGNLLWFSDTLKTTAKIDTIRTTARIDTNSGVATLAVSGEINLSDSINSITVTHVNDTEYAQGLPGNSLEVKGPAVPSGTLGVMTETEIPDFIGDSQGVTSDPDAVRDSSIDTWFEWEKYLVPKEQGLTARGTSWQYMGEGTGVAKKVFGSDGVTLDLGWKYTVKWPDDTATPNPLWIVTPIDTVLENHSLVMDIELNDKQDISWIEFSPFLSGVSLDVFSLDSLAVSEDGAKWTELMGKSVTLNPSIDMPVDVVKYGLAVKDYSGMAVIPCTTGSFKYIRLKMSQAAPYKTIIGHKYYLKTVVTTTKKKSLFGLINKTSTKTSYVRTESTELAEEKQSGQYILGFGKKKTISETALDTCYDTFMAYRFCIGIRELKLLGRTYTETSVIYTKPIVFTIPVCAAGIVASEVIPQSFGSGDWIKYEISTDGTNWSEAVPQGSASGTDGVVQFDPTNIIYLRISLSRPAELTSETPVINYYAVKAVPYAG